MKRFDRAGFLVLLCALPGLSPAAEVSGTSTISWMQTYETYEASGLPAAADTIFTLTSGAANSCVGFWLRTSDAGYQANYATLLAAQMSKRAVTVYALDDDSAKWAGSTSTRYCLVSAIRWQ
jgi:hypothetical protein